MFLSFSTVVQSQPPVFKSGKTDEADLHSKLEEAFNALELKNTKISELESTLNSTKIKMEYEELLTRRFAAELEYLVISKTIQSLKAGHMDQINLAVYQKNVSATKPAPVIEEEDAKKLKNRVWRYVYCLIIQSVLLLLLVLYIVVLKFSLKKVEVIPT
ncbi:putative WPP domain-interacting protein/3 [Helianthus annuus]|nr:putative WPP domain-interacting protein/3 [Helianthus annuus]